MKFKKIIKKTKGFIGAIGDDLPSLIPIFLGLLVFFSVFLTTYDNYKDSTENFSYNQEALSIAMTLKSEPLITDQNHFTELCNKVKSNHNWNAFLTDLPLNVNYYKPISYENMQNNIMKLNGENLTCNNNLEELDMLNSDKIPLVYMFPIAIQKEKYTYQARLYILIVKE